MLCHNPDPEHCAIWSWNECAILCQQGWFMAITVHRCTVRFIRQIINAAQRGGVTAGWNHSVWWLLFFHCLATTHSSKLSAATFALAFLSCCRVLKGICGERCNARWRHRQTDRRRGRQTDTERNAACSDKTGKEVWVGFLWQPHTSPRFAHMYTHTHRHTRPAKAWRVKEMFVCDYCGVCAEK